MENSVILEEILEELTENAKHISSSSLEKFANEIIKARHIFVAGAGRSGFVARGFANRLMHLGLEVFFVGEPTTPAIEKKDLLIISSGSGETDSLIVMANKAKEAGASVVTVTIHPEASIGKVCESCIVIPGATPKSNLEDTSESAQPMGNAFEQMSWIVYDAVIMILMKKLGKTEEVLASAQDNSDEEKKENQITNDVEIENEKLTDNAESSEIEEPADSEETNDPFAEIPQVVLSKPVDYSLNQAIRQLEQMEASDERYAQIVENAEKYPEKLLINLANNPEMIAFVADYKGNTRDYDKAELTEKELQEEYPLFLQWDKRWGCLAYGDDSNVAISGCGPTTLAMAVVALTGNEEATPAAIAKFAMQEGYYMSGTGTMWSLMTEGAAAYGVRSEQINISQTEIKQHLDQGDIVICSVRQGDFTTGGHFILLYDYDDEGFSINDPFSLYRSGQKWDYGKIRSQIKAVWALKAK